MLHVSNPKLSLQLGTSCRTFVVARQRFPRFVPAPRMKSVTARSEKRIERLRDRGGEAEGVDRGPPGRERENAGETAAASQVVKDHDDREDRRDDATLGANYPRDRSAGADQQNAATRDQGRVVGSDPGRADVAQVEERGGRQHQQHRGPVDQTLNP